MADWITVSFDCPPDLHEEIESTVDDSTEHENRSQFIRFAIRNATGQVQVTLPKDLQDQIRHTADSSVMFDDEGQVLRAAVRSFIESGQDEFAKSR